MSSRAATTRGKGKPKSAIGKEAQHRQQRTKACRKRTAKNSRAEALLRADFCRSDREIGREAKVSPTLVGKVRQRLESTGEILPRVPIPTQNGQPSQPCLGEASILHVSPTAIRPAPENDAVYDPIRDDDPAFVSFVEAVRQNGITDPIIVSRDGRIISGHRRHRAATVLEMEQVPVVIRPDVSWKDDRDEFLRLLAACNTQRVKTTSEAIREEIIQADGDTWHNLWTYRQDASQVQVDGTELITLGPRRRRSKITEKLSFRQAIIDAVESRKGMKTGDRKVFYLLLNVTGLLRNDVRKLPFLNNPESYNDVTDMLTRLRLDGSIPFDSIVDETRPVIEWNTHRSVSTFINQQFDGFLCDYWRDLQQSQSNHIEMLSEKNTVAADIEQIAAKYTIPLTSGRGYSSLPPRKAMMERFEASGREKLVVIVVSDCDPEGVDIPHAFGVSLRDDFHIDSDQLVVIKAALTYAQVQQLDLHEGQFAKKDGARYKAFVQKYGTRCWELEAVDTKILRATVEARIRRVLDLAAFERELEIQRTEQQQLNEHRQAVMKALAGII
jgi:hypothetical protein